MKIIKQGKPYRKHKCCKCKTIYVYHIFDDTIGELIYCPECNNFLDFHIFDKKISEEEYKKLNNLGDDDCE